MRGIPKFLLPIRPGPETLLEHHVRLMEDVCDRILIPTTAESLPFLSGMALPARVTLLTLKTDTMAETVVQALAGERFNQCILGMPDTYYEGNPYQALSMINQPLALAVWKSREDQKGKLGSVQLEDNKVLQVVDKDPQQEFGVHWGAMAFSHDVANTIDSNWDTVGNLIHATIRAGTTVEAALIPGDYYDCGTFGEYVLGLAASANQIIS
jgi:hypothetical protein